MGLKTALGIGVAAVVIVAGGAYVLKHQQVGTASAPIVARLSTPPGVTFQKVKVGKVTMIPGSSSDQQEQVIVYANGDGKTLYTFDKDTTPGKSACTDDQCVKAWPAMVAPADSLFVPMYIDRPLLGESESNVSTFMPLCSARFITLSTDFGSLTEIAMPSTCFDIRSSMIFTCVEPCVFCGTTH